jgi:hypothetical protein
MTEDTEDYQPIDIYAHEKQQRAHRKNFARARMKALGIKKRKIHKNKKNYNRW